MISRRRISRLLCVQCCYATYYIDDYEAQDLLDVAIRSNQLKYMSRYNPELFNSLFDSCIVNKENDHKLISMFLDGDWSLDRIDYLKTSVIRVGIAELRLVPKEQNNMVVNEYVTLSTNFLQLKESNFVNAILCKIANHLVV